MKKNVKSRVIALREKLLKSGKISKSEKVAYDSYSDTWDGN